MELLKLIQLVEISQTVATWNTYTTTFGIWWLTVKLNCSNANAVWYVSIVNRSGMLHCMAILVRYHYYFDWSASLFVCMCSWIGSFCLRRSTPFLDIALFSVPIAKTMQKKKQTKFHEKTPTFKNERIGAVAIGQNINRSSAVHTIP